MQSNRGPAEKYSLDFYHLQKYQEKQTKDVMTFWFKYVSLLLLVRKIKAVPCPWECLCYYPSGEAIMDCYNQKLEKIPTTIPDYITNVDLSNNSLTELEYNTFPSRRSRIQILDLSNNKINYIEELAFRPLKKLKKVYLLNNHIQTFPSDALESHNEIELLVLSENSIKISQYGPFLISKSLQVLDLNGCSIESLSLLAFSGLPNLQKVDLSRNKLTTISDFHHRDVESMKTQFVFEEKQLDCTPEISQWISIHTSKDTKPCTFKSSTSIKESTVTEESTTGHVAPRPASETAYKRKVRTGEILPPRWSSGSKVLSNKLVITMFVLSCWVIKPCPR